MTFRVADEELREQFYAWELRGRGWDAAEAPIHLEPPFRPFFGHYLEEERPFADDGRHETVLSYAASALKSLFSPRRGEAVAPSEEDEEEPLPRLLETSDSLTALVCHVPQDRVVRLDAMAACLQSLGACRYPIALEIVGKEDSVALEFAVRSRDESRLTAALRSYFPDLTLVADDHLDHAFRKAYAAFGAYELGLGREFMLPLVSPRTFDPDPFIPLVAALEDTGKSEVCAIQVLFEGAQAPWAESVFRAISDNAGGDFFSDAPEIGKLGKQKALQPLFAVTMRVAVGAQNEERARDRLLGIAAALAQFEHPTGNRFFRLPDHLDYDLREDVLLRQSHRTGMLLGLDELLGLVHLPSASVTSKALVGRDRARSSPPPEPEPHGILLGTNRHAGMTTPVTLTLDRARRHVHIVGASGSGKSNLLLRVLADHIRTGGGAALLDPHGDLVDDLLTRIPEDRSHDVVLFDPADVEAPVGFNVLHAHSDLERALLGSDLVAIFRRLSTSWGDQMHSVLANAIQAFLESTRGGTIADLRKFLVDSAFRKAFLTTIPDEETVYYWEKEFPLLRGRPQAPILTRLDAFLRPKLVRHMVAQRESSVDFRRVMDEGKIFVAKLAAGAIGDENAALLGSFLIAKFHQTAMSRQDIRASERRPFLLAADECQHFVTPSMGAILSGTRKFGLSLVLVHQDLRQLERRDAEVYATLLANAGTRIVFRVGDADARVLAEGFTHFEAEDLRALPQGQAIARFDRADQDFRLEVPLAEAVEEEAGQLQRERIIAASRARYGKPPDSSPVRRVDEDVDRTVAEIREESSPSPPHPLEPLVPPTPSRRQKTTATENEVATPSLGRGGPQHKYLQELVKRFAEEKGYRATIEKALPGGGSVDVVLERANEAIAVEISVSSTSAYETGNIEKCMAAGFDRIVVLATDKRRLHAIEAAARDKFGPSLRAEFLEPEEFLLLLGSDSPEPNVVAGYAVKVTYRRPSDDSAAERQRAIAAVVARSTRKLR